MGITYRDFNETNTVALFMGPIWTMHEEITTDELSRLIGSEEPVVLLDVRNRDYYSMRHICGAANMPLPDMERDIAERAGWDDLVVVYGSGPENGESAVAADKLVTLGYKRVLRYAGGAAEWSRANLCMEGSVKVRPRELEAAPVPALPAEAA